MKLKKIFTQISKRKTAFIITWSSGCFLSHLRPRRATSICHGLNLRSYLKSRMLDQLRLKKKMLYADANTFAVGEGLDSIKDGWFKRLKQSGHLFRRNVRGPATALLKLVPQNQGMLHEDQRCKLFSWTISWETIALQSLTQSHHPRFGWAPVKLSEI